MGDLLTSVPKPLTVIDEVARYIEHITNQYSPSVTQYGESVFDKYMLDFDVFQLRGEVRSAYRVKYVETDNGVGATTEEYKTFRLDQLVIPRPFLMWNKYIRFRNIIECSGAVINAIEHRKKRAADSLQATLDASDRATLEALKTLVLKIDKSY